MENAENMVALTEIARLMALVIIAGASIAIVGWKKAPEQFSKIVFALVQSGSLIRMTTALVIVAAVMGLRVMDKISSEATITILIPTAAKIDLKTGPSSLRAKRSNPEQRALLWIASSLRSSQ